MHTAFQRLISFKQGRLTASFTDLPPLAGNNKVNQWVFSLTFCHLDACHLNNIYLEDSLWERKHISTVGHMTSFEIYVYWTSSVWLMLSSGLVFHNHLPPLTFLLKALKAEIFSRAFPVRLLLSGLPFFFPHYCYLFPYFAKPLPTTWDFSAFKGQFNLM